MALAVAPAAPGRVARRPAGFLRGSTRAATQQESILPTDEEPATTGNDSRRAAAALQAAADRWFYAERDVCGEPTVDHPGLVCVLAVGHGGGHDPFFLPSPEARFAQWVEATGGDPGA